jgi:hypothetical protein
MKFSTLSLAVVSVASITTAASAGTVYNSLPSPAPAGITSLGYQATSTAEFGDHIALAGTDRALTDVTVALSDWAKKSEWPTVGDADSFSHLLTLNLYAVDTSGPTPVVGSLVATKTINADILYRPEVYSANGIYQTVTFDFSADGVTLPNELIATVAYNTQTHGASPIGAAGPYNSLNVGLASALPSIGTDVNPDNAFWNTSFAAFYTDGGVGGVGTLRQDTGWAPNSIAMSINAVPEPTTLAALAGASVLGLRRRRA